MGDNFRDDYDNGLDSSYYLSTGNLGAPTSPMTPKQLEELGLRLNAGMKNVEIGTLARSKFQTIPEQHFEEMRRLADLTDGTISLHAPITEGFDPAGFKEGTWSEDHRAEIERELKDVLRKAHKVDPKGNIRVNMHTSSDVQAYAFEKNKEKYPDDVKAMWFVDQETGKTGALPTTEEFDKEGKFRPVGALEKIEDINRQQWSDQRLQLRSQIHNRKAYERDRLVHTDLLSSSIKEREAHGLEPEKEIKLGDSKVPTSKIANDYLAERGHIKDYEGSIIESSKGLFDEYLKYYAPEKEERDKKELKEKLKSQFSGLLNGYSQQKKIQSEYEDKINRKIIDIEDPIKKYELVRQLEAERNAKIKQALGRDLITADEFASIIDRTDTPSRWKPVEEFALDKTKQTVANAAMYGLEISKNDPKKAPVITFENVFPGVPFSRGDSMVELVKETRNHLAKELQEKKKYSGEQAKKIAEQLIGATWDVGHIYHLKKHGFSDKEILEEAKKVAPYLKHVHLTDNFGYHDSHLPLGMGTVPIKENIKIFEEAGYKGTMIEEAGAYAAEFGRHPFPESLRGLNAPLYSDDGNAPRWKMIQDRYSENMPGYSGFGDILPEQHFQSLYGAGFTTQTIPRELGGQSPGQQSRFSGTPNV